MSDIFTLLKDYRLKIVLSWSFIILLVGALLETTYRTYASAVIRLVTVEEFSYILVALVASTSVVYLSLRNLGVMFSIKISKLFASLSLFSVSIILLILSRLDPEHVVLFEGFSFTTLLVGLILLVFDTRRPRDVLPLFSFYLLVPVPGSVIDAVTPVISRYVGKLAALVTGTKFIETPGYAVIEVNTPQGPQQFSVEAACTGIVTISSILSLVPLVLYIISFSVAKTSKKIIASIASLASSLAVGLLGNFVRVLLVIWASESYGVEVGLQYFHYSPSILYSVISVIVVVGIVDRIMGLKSLFPDIPLSKIYSSLTYVVSVLVVIAVIVGSYHVASTYVSETSSGITINPLVVNATTIQLTQEPGAYIFRNATITYSQFDAWLTRVLGAITVHRVGLLYNGKPYSGYVEIVDTPARLHTWQLCLTLQGYTVESSWTEVYSGARLYYIMVSKGGYTYLLTYVLIPIYTSDAPGTPLTARVSLFSRINPSALDQHISDSRNALTSVLGGIEVSQPSVQTGFLTLFSALAVVFTISAFITPLLPKIWRVIVTGRLWARRGVGVE